MRDAPFDAIAVVGVAGRFPGARDPEELWQLAVGGSCVVTRQLDAEGRLLWARGLLSSIEDFDPDFFGISAREALVLDPQHRLLLECAWEALADTGRGWREDARLRRTAAFLGTNQSGYRDLLSRAAPSVSALELESATDKDFAATRIAYRLGLEGPSLTVQSACSTSLVAVHLACQSLLEFEADQALAGGASFVLPDAIGWRYEPQSIHSADGVCRPFDAGANGTVMGDGAGIVVLRRLEDAIADGVRIYAVIRGSAINNDGARKVGFAAPSAAGQEDVIRAAHARAGVTPAEVQYVEAHGTGTSLGDRVEVRALKNVFGEASRSCVLGSIKSAIGHLDNAAGVVGLIRCCLALERGVLPGTANHLATASDVAPFSVLGAARPWESRDVRVAGVSSFGVGGTNAHVVLEEHRGARARAPARQRLVDAGYRPRRFWPEPASAGRSDAIEVSLGVEYRRGVWRHLADDAEQATRSYGQIVLAGDGAPATETLRARLALAGAPIAVIDGLADELPATGDRMLVVCALGMADAAPDRRRAYDAVTAMARQWSSPGRRAAGIDVVLVTREAFSVLGDERGDPALAALTGLARVLSMETPSVRVRAVDVQDTSPEGLALLAREALAWRAEPVVARRGRRWWRLDHESIQVPPDARRRGGRPDAVSVVLGTGQIGGAAARALSAAGRRVVLVARPGAVETAARLASALTDVRWSVPVEECDAGDGRQVHALLARIAERHGPIDQIVHAAGISGEAAYQDSGALPRWQEAAHFRIKIDGIAALGEAAERHGVGRVTLTSSLAGALGALSLGPYSAAAAAMDAYAERLDGDRTRWLSVAWDAWSRTGASTAHEARMVRDGLTADEADRAMAALLGSDLSGRVLVAKGDFAARWERFVVQPLRRAEESRTAAAADSPAEDMEPTDILGLLLEIWRGCLSDPSVDADDDLVDRGADSITWIEVAAVAERRIGHALPDSLLFDAPTARQQAERIGQILAGAARDRTPRERVRAWGGAGATIWCLPPIGGSADGFEDLASALGDRRVRAVAGLPLADVLEDESVESIAARHLALLDDGRPPSVLVGWSFGAVIAFHVAQLSVAATGRAPAVVAIDMPAPGVPSPRRVDQVGDAEILAAITSHRAREAGRPSEVGGWEAATDADGFAAFVDQLRGDLLPAGFTVELARRMVAGYRRRLAAIERYQPGSYPGRIALVAAREAEFGETGLLRGVIAPPADDPSWGWQSLSPTIVSTTVLDGHHVTLLQPPAVREVAATLARLIDG